jgi:hypothetical protein
MAEEKRVQDKKKNREQLRATNSHSDVEEKRPGEDSMWKGSLGGEAANQVFSTTSALRDVTEEANENHPDGYVPEAGDEVEERRKAG